MLWGISGTSLAIVCPPDPCWANDRRYQRQSGKVMQACRNLTILLNVIDDASQVSTGDIALDHDPALHPFTHDEVRTAVLSGLSHGGEWNLGSRGCVDEGVLDGARVARLLPFVTNHRVLSAILRKRQPGLRACATTVGL